MGVENENEDPKAVSNDLGYDMFDSKDFEQDYVPDSGDEDHEETKDLVVDAKETDKSHSGDAAIDDEDLTAEDKLAVKDLSSKDVLDDSLKAGEASVKAGESVPYEPDLKYKVYDQEKEFPEQIKAVVKTKEQENFFRELLSKADGLDGLKPRHQEIVEDRDQLRASFETQKNNINRALQLRDKQPDLFAAEFGVSDDWILRMANRIADAKETPAAWANFQRQRGEAVSHHQERIQFEQQQQSFNNDHRTSHEAEMFQAMSQPEVVSFSQRFDQINGAGAFREEVRKHGFYYVEQTKKHLPASEAVRAVYQKFSSVAGPVAPVASVTGAVDTASKSKQRPQSIPNTGRGRNVSPTGARHQSLKGLKEYVANLGD